MDVELGGFEESEAAFVPMPLEEWRGPGHTTPRRIAEREHWAALGLKRCTKCGMAKPFAGFYRDKAGHDGYDPRCQKCKAKGEARYRNTAQAQVRTHARRRRYTLKQKQGRRCSQCGEDHPAAIVFHHRDPATKKFRIVAREMCGRTDAEIEAEIANCDVLCANCHRILHWDETDAKYAELEEIDSHRERQLAMAGT